MKSNKDIDGASIVGSYSRGDHTESSDIDLMVFTEDSQRFIENKSWIENFGSINKTQQELWGVVNTLRVFYKNGIEVEYNFASINWASVPVDQSTFKVVSNGFKILYDPTGKLEKLNNEVNV